MRFGLGRKRKPVPGEYPETFVKGWMARTLPTTSPEEAASAVRHLRGQGWSEKKLAEFILPYMPVPARSPTAPAPASGAAQERTAAITVPQEVTTGWLDHNLPAMDLGQLRSVLQELERRGWPPGSAAMAILPHLLPKLGAGEARAIRSGLKDLGMTDREIARATRRP